MRSSLPSLLALVGLFLALALLTAPLWLNLGKETPERPVLAQPAASPCVDSPEVMRRNHMLLLYDWREQALRQGTRASHSEDGSQDLRLQICLNCHDRETFCEACHAMHNVRPNCWNCHGEATR